MHKTEEDSCTSLNSNHNMNQHCYQTNMNTNMNTNAISVVNGTTGARSSVPCRSQPLAPPQPLQQSQSVPGIGEDFERNQRMVPYEYGYVRTPHGWFYDPYRQNTSAQPNLNAYHGNGHGNGHGPLNPSSNPTHFGRRSNSSLSSTLHSITSDASPLITGSARARQESKANGHRHYQHVSRSVPLTKSVLVNRFHPNEKHFMSSNASLNTSARPNAPYSNSHELDKKKDGTGAPLAQSSPLQAFSDITNHNGSPENNALNGSFNLKPKTNEKAPFDSSSSVPSSAAVTKSTVSPHTILHNLKRNMFDLDSVSSRSSSSPTNPGIVSNLSPESDQDSKRQRSSSSISSHSNSVYSSSLNDHCNQDSMLHLLCEATEIVAMRMEQVAPVSSPTSRQNISSATIEDRPKPSPTIVNGPVLCIPTSELAKKEDAKNCNCPRSRCIKLYCECFQAGKYCSSDCCCKKCLNLVSESGPVGKRTFAIQNILARNPYAFHKDKELLEKKYNRASGLNCRCVKSQCLKLYCDCFQSGKVCGKDCMCVKCLNTAEESGDYGEATKARSLRLSRNPNAFKKKEKKTGEGCSCKNSKCLKKYCDCFNNGLSCTSKCSCKDCQNYATAEDPQIEEKMQEKILHRIHT